MKLAFLNTVLIVALAVLGYSRMEAQSGSSPARIQEVLAVDQAWADAFAACDLKRMDSLLAPELTVIQMTGVVSTKSEFLNIVRPCSMNSAKPTSVTARIYGDTAVVVGRLNFIFNKTPGAQVYNRIYVKQSGGWRLVSDSHTGVAAPAKSSK